MVWEKIFASRVWCQCPGKILYADADTVRIDYGSRDRRVLLSFARAEVIELEYEIGGYSRQMRVGERVRSILTTRDARDRFRLVPYAE